MKNEIRFVGDLARLELKPGDRFVLSCDQVLSQEQVRHIRLAWKDFVGGDREDLKLLILDHGIKLGAVATNDDPAPEAINITLRAGSSFDRAKIEALMQAMQISPSDGQPL